jgi:hypothetical protein
MVFFDLSKKFHNTGLLHLELDFGVVNDELNNGIAVIIYGILNLANTISFNLSHVAEVLISLGLKK